MGGGGAAAGDLGLPFPLAGFAAAFLAVDLDDLAMRMLSLDAARRLLNKCAAALHDA
jgi:hypothetical protein